MIKQEFEQPSNIKLLINIGCLLDVPTGFFVRGKYGENILVGGLGAITAVVGRGNRFKSTILHYMMLSAVDRICSTTETSMSTYDTEINIHETALQRLMSRFTNLVNKNIFYEGIWNITDSTIYTGNTWWEKAKEYLSTKKDNSKNLLVDTPFLDRDNISLQKAIVPTFGEIDSFSEFQTEDIINIQNENELGESGGNMIHARQGLAKTRFLMEIPSLFGRVNHFFLMTAHLGDELQLASGPFTKAPVKALQHMKIGEKIKGVTNKFFFLMNNCWYASNSVVLNNQTTKAPEYPRNSNDVIPGDTDLNEVTLIQLRGKSGPTGFSLPIIVSQSEGVLPTLTEFNYIKSTKDRFGISGTQINYHLDIYPDVNLSRTTVRGKIDNDVKLRRAINITAELYQVHLFHRYYYDVLCEPKELYDDLVKLGYDWNVILEHTRGWWCFNDAKHPLKFLSIVDLLNIRAGKYIPYWIDQLPNIRKEVKNV